MAVVVFYWALLVRLLFKICFAQLDVSDGSTNGPEHGHVQQLSTHSGEKQVFVSPLCVYGSTRQRITMVKSVSQPETRFYFILFFWSVFFLQR